MTVSLTTINLNKKYILYIWISFNTFSTNRNTVRLIYVVTNRPEEPAEKKNWYLSQGSGILKINLLTTSNCCKENERVYKVKNNFDSKKLNNLITLKSAIRWDYSTLKKGYKIYLQVECHFSYYYSQDFIIYCYIHRSDKLHVRAI